MLPDVDKTIRIWRSEAAKENLELYICRFESFGETGSKFLSPEIDAAIEFQPFSNIIKDYRRKNKFSLITRLINKCHRKLKGNNVFPDLINYKKYVQFAKKCSMLLYTYYPCVTPGWDNSPRRNANNFFAFCNSTPALFGTWLQDVIHKFKPYSEEENFIFINAWNEWAEGNHLEPDMKWGDRYLKEVKRAVEYGRINNNCQL